MLWMTWQLLHKLLPLSKNEKTMSSVQSVTQLISALPICVDIVQIYLHSYATLASTSPVSAWHVSHVTCHMSASINRSFFSYIKTIPPAPAACCLLLPKHIHITLDNWTRSAAFPRRPGPSGQAAAAQKYYLAAGILTWAVFTSHPLSSRDLLPWKYAASLVLNFRIQPPHSGAWRWVARHMWEATPAQ